MKPEQPRQAMMLDDGSITSVPVKDDERPELEQQGDLMLWADETERLERWNDGSGR